MLGNVEYENLYKSKMSLADEESKILASKDKEELSYRSEEYDVNVLKDLYSTFLRLRQWEDDFDGEYKFVKRLIRVKRFIPKDVLYVYKPSIHILGGLFMEVEVCLVNNKHIWYKGTGGNRTAMVPSDPKSLGLPGFDEVCWNTYRGGAGNYGVVISKRGNQNWISDQIVLSKHWEYVTCEIDG